jgi:hypothetical protein
MARRVTGAALLLACALPTQAQDTEPRFDALVNTFQKDYFRLGALLQVVGDAQGTRTDGAHSGFSVANAWLRIGGTLDGGFGYLFQSNMVRTPSIVDAMISYRAAPAVVVQAGRFNVPFSRELMIYAGSIDFVNRSAVVTALSPNRDVGVSLGGRPGSGAFEYAVGAFNGNRASGGGNDNNALLYTARLAIRPDLATPDAPSDQFEIAVNVAQSEDSTARIAGLVPAFNGTRTLLGVDLRLQRGRWMVSAEAIAAKLVFTGGPQRDPIGWHATAGYLLTPRTQGLLRWDVLETDGLALDVNRLIVGYNLWPTNATELQLNYLLPVDGGGMKRHQLLVNLQVSF